MLAVAGSILSQGARRSFSPLASTTSCIRSFSRKSSPLSLFICAVDEASDQAGAALVAALKQLTGRQVELHGVGGPLLADHGLHSVVSEEQLHTLAAAEVIPPTYSLLKEPGSDSISKTSYAKIFKDVIWEAALDGCRGRASSTQQQSKQHPTQAGSSSSSSAPTSAPGPQQHVCYDAVVTIGSAAAAQLTLTFLRQAEQMQKAKLPVVVQYTVPGLWDRHGAAAAAARWAKLVDHVMCSLPYEPALLHAAGVPSSFVGHPLLQQMLGSSTSTKSFGGKARRLANLMRQQQQPDRVADTGSSLQQQQQQQAKQGQQHLFAAGDANAFWRSYEAVHSMQQEAAAQEAVADPTQSTPGNNSGNRASGSSSHSRLSPSKRKQPSGLRQQQRQEQQLQQRLLLALLPGTTEDEVISSMAVCDNITQQLQQKYPHLIATMHVPDVLVQSAVLATVNFKVPVLVVSMGERRAADALAAAAVAVSHPGPASLQAVAAGVPLVCVRHGSLLKGTWGKWRHQKHLPYGSIPNLLLGRAALPEASSWEQGSVQAGVRAAAELLEAHTEAMSAADRSNSQGTSYGQQLLAQQKAALQEALLQLAPLAHQQTASTAEAAAEGWQLPATAAARTLLELINLRQQQEAGQAGRRRASSSSRQGSGDTAESLNAASSSTQTRQALA